VLASRRSRALAVLLAGLVAVAIGCALQLTGAINDAERATVAARFGLRHTAKPTGIAVVSVDDVTFDALHRQWPFPRSWHGRVIDALHRAGAREIVYDVQFTEPTKPREDMALYRAIGRAGGALLATSEMDDHGRTNVLGGDANLAHVHARAAAANLADDPDGRVTRVNHAVSHLPTLAVAAAERLTGHPVPAGAFRDGAAWIDYRGGPGTFPTLSFADVLRGQFDPRLVRGKVVVVGAGSPTLQDVHATPTGSKLMSGPEVQANAIWSALHGFPLRDASLALDLALIAALGLLPAVARLRLRLTATFGVALAAAVALLAGAQVAFDQGLIVVVVAPLAALLAGLLGTLLASHLAESRARRWLVRHSALLERVVDERTAELRDAQLEVLERLAQAAEFRDAGTGAHVSRIGGLAEKVALALGLSEDEAELLRHATPLHDVGKVGIPDRILLKPGALDPDEWLVMQSHTVIGARILAGSKSPVVRLAEEIALTHHERWDGGGYPNRLRGDQIPLSGRICAVVDVFDALRSERPYKAAWSLEDTLAELERQRGRHFDPRVLDAFMSIVPGLGEDAAEPPVMMAA
jgi:response regulator RpfG family c-di-GMP phosphodiesterase